MGITVAIAVIATFSGLFASLHPVSRLYKNAAGDATGSIAIGCDLAILIPFTVLTNQNNILTVVVSVSVAAAIAIGRVIAIRKRAAGLSRWRQRGHC